MSQNADLPEITDQIINTEEATQIMEKNPLVKGLFNLASEQFTILRDCAYKIFLESISHRTNDSRTLECYFAQEMNDHLLEEIQKFFNSVLIDAKNGLFEEKLDDYRLYIINLAELILTLIKEKINLDIKEGLIHS